MPSWRAGRTDIMSATADCELGGSNVLAARRTCARASNGMGAAPADHSVHRRALGAVLQQRRAHAVWRAVLLLVSAPVDHPERGDHRHRLSARALIGRRGFP